MPYPIFLLFPLYGAFRSSFTFMDEVMVRSLTSLSGVIQVYQARFRVEAEMVGLLSTVFYRRVFFRWTSCLEYIDFVLDPWTLFFSFLCFCCNTKRVFWRFC